MEFDEGDWSDGCDFLLRIIPHSRRWISFDINYGNPIRLASVEHIRSCCMLMHGLAVDILQSLKWNLPKSDEELHDAVAYHA